MKERDVTWIQYSSYRPELADCILTVIMGNELYIRFMERENYKSSVSINIDGEQRFYWIKNKRMDKVEFLEKVANQYPTFFEWLLFHPERF